MRYLTPMLRLLVARLLRQALCPIRERTTVGGPVVAARVCSKLSTARWVSW